MTLEGLRKSLRALPRRYANLARKEFDMLFTDDFGYESLDNEHLTILLLRCQFLFHQPAAEPRGIH